MLADLPKSVLERIKPVLPKEAASCDSITGALTLDLAIKLSKRRNGIVFSITNINRVTPVASGGLMLELALAIYVYGGNIAHKKAKETVLKIIPLVISCIYDNDWGLDDCDDPRNISALPLFAGQLKDKKKLALWGISWAQDLTINAFDAESFEKLTNISGVIDVHEADGTPEKEFDITIEQEDREQHP